MRQRIVWFSVLALSCTIGCNNNPAPTSVNPTSIADMTGAGMMVEDMAGGGMMPADMATGSTAPASAAVSIRDNFYTPSSVTIAAGGTVTWTWGGANPHTVTSNGGLFDSSPPKSTGTFAFTFPSAGTFAYHCLVHGFVQSGTVIVQ